MPEDAVGTPPAAAPAGTPPVVETVRVRLSDQTFYDLPKGQHEVHELIKKGIVEKDKTIAELKPHKERVSALEAENQQLKAQIESAGKPDPLRDPLPDPIEHPDDYASAIERRTFAKARQMGEYHQVHESEKQTLQRNVAEFLADDWAAIEAMNNPDEKAVAVANYEERSRQMGIRIAEKIQSLGYGTRNFDGTNYLAPGIVDLVFKALYHDEIVERAKKSGVKQMEELAKKADGAPSSIVSAGGTSAGSSFKEKILANDPSLNEELAKRLEKEFTRKKR